MFLRKTFDKKDRGREMGESERPLTNLHPTEGEFFTWYSLLLTRYLLIFTRYLLRMLVMRNS